MKLKASAWMRHKSKRKIIDSAMMSSFPSPICILLPSLVASTWHRQQLQFPLDMGHTFSCSYWWQFFLFWFHWRLSTVMSNISITTIRVFMPSLINSSHSSLYSSSVVRTATHTVASLAVPHSRPLTLTTFQHVEILTRVPIAPRLAFTAMPMALIGALEMSSRLSPTYGQCHGLSFVQFSPLDGHSWGNTSFLLLQTSSTSYLARNSKKVHWTIGHQRQNAQSTSVPYKQLNKEAISSVMSTTICNEFRENLYVIYTFFFFRNEEKWRLSSFPRAALEIDKPWIRVWVSCILSLMMKVANMSVGDFGVIFGVYNICVVLYCMTVWLQTAVDDEKAWLERQGYVFVNERRNPTLRDERETTVSEK